MMAVLYAGATGLTFLVGIVLARSLGAAGYGVYALAMTTATLVGMATEFGLPMLAMREVGAARASGDWGSVRGLLRWSDRLILALSLALIVLSYVVYGIWGQRLGSSFLATLLWAVVLIPFVSIGKLRSFVLMALDSVFSSQFPVMILRPMLFLAGCLLLWRFWPGYGPEAAMAAQVAGAAVAMIVVLVQFRRVRPQALAEAVPVRRIGAWLSACIPMGLSEGMRLLQGQLGLLLVGALAGTTQAGFYRVADAVTQITGLVASVVGTAATPMFGRLWSAGDRAGLERVTLLSAWAMFGGAILVGLPIALLGDWAFPFVFGRDFAGSVPVFLVLWLGWSLTASLGMCLQLANMTGRHVLASQSFVVIALVNAGVGFIAIPAWGALGGAAATVAGNLAGSGYCTVRLWREGGLNATIFNRGSLAMLRDAIVELRKRLRPA
jgi:O-antigen/teichoic acid export membrane protein